MASESTSIWQQVGREIERYRTDIRSLPVSELVAATELQAELRARFDFDEPIALERLTTDVAQLLRERSTHVTHPRYFGLFNPSVYEAAIVADALVATFNPQLATWTHAPAANELEQLTLRRLAEIVGFEPGAVVANFTTGGFEANLSAVVVALTRRFDGYATDGLRGIDARPAIYITSETHHSFVKISRLTGLGTGVLREVPTTNALTMDTRRLVQAIEADRHSGFTPLMIVGTVGSTGIGVVDPVPEMSEVAREYNTWLHVDAAWGGAAALVPRLSAAMSGVARADSLTWDAHKWLSVPMGAGMFFCRHAEAVRRAFAVATSYMPSAAEDCTTDPYTMTVQWSRRAIGLKLFMTLAERGLEGIAAAIDQQARNGDKLRRLLIEAGWTIVNQTELPLVCATHEDVRAGMFSASALVSEVNARGRVWISAVQAGSESVIRMCITSVDTNEQDLGILIDELESVRLKMRDSR